MRLEAWAANVAILRDAVLRTAPQDEGGARHRRSQNMKVVIPDLVSNSYFPAIAAVEMGFFKDEGIDAELELIYPVGKCYEALRDGKADFVGGSSHSAPTAFPEWQGVKFLAALAQHTYWFLIMRKD